MAQPLSLDPTQQAAPEPISLDTSVGQASVNLPPEVADKRARRAEFGLGPVTGVTKEAAQQSIGSGREAELRQQASVAIDRQRSDQKSALIQQMARAQDGSISQDQLKYVNDKFGLANFLGQNPPTNPGSVLEDYYAGQYLKPMYDVSDQFNQGSFMPEAMRQIPDQVRDIKKTTQSITEAREMIKTRLENAKALAEDQSTLGRAADFMKEMVPGYTEQALKGGWSNIFSGGLRGEYLQAKSNALLSLPPDKLKEQFNADMDELEKKDPALAVEYGEHMLGMTTSEKHLNNSFTLLDLSAIPVAGAAKLAARGIKGVAEATGVTSKLAEMAELRNNVVTAAKDVVKSQESQGIPLRVLVNQHFGEQSNRIDYELKVWRDQYKEIAHIEDHYANEGLRQQALTRVFNNIKSLEEQKKDLQVWHANKLTETAGVDGGQDIIVNQAIEKDPAVASANAVGDLKTAGIEKAAIETSQELKGTGNPAVNSIEALTSNIRADTLEAISDPGNGGQEFVNRMRETGDQFTQKLKNATQNIMRVQRLPGLLANKEALKSIVEYTKDLYPGTRNAILNVSDPILNKEFNTWTQKMFFGRMTGEYFASKAEAEGAKELYGLTGEVQQKGLAWYLEVEKPLDETMHPIRDWLITTKEQETPGGWLNATVGWLRTPEDTLSLEQNLQRKLATYNVSPFMNFAKEAMQDVKNLASLKNVKNLWSDWKDWERIVAYARDAPVPGSTTGEKGYFVKTGQELDDLWMRNLNNKLPTTMQKAAYFQFKRVVEYDRVLRSMALYRNKMRVGTESHAVSVLDPQGNKLTSQFFDGVIHKELPGGVGNIWLADRGGDGAIYAANAIPNVEALREAVSKGELKLIELFEPGLKPFNGFAKVGDSHIRYVAVRSAETKPLDITQQLPRKGGGHFEYDYEHYIKQANLRYDEHSKMHVYEGDTTLMPISIRAMGLNVVPKLNKVRELIKAGDIEGAKAFATSKEGLAAVPWEKQMGWFLPSKDSLDRTVPPRFNLNEDFKVVPSGKSISDMDNDFKMRFKNKDFLDGTKEGSLVKSSQVQFTGERDNYDVMTLNDVGTRNNPVYQYEPAKLVDPITTMNRALSRIVNSTVMDDYKIFSVESWIREARNWLNVGNRDISDVDRSPFYYFNHPEWKSGIPDDIRKRLEGTKLKIDKLVGIPSTTDSFLHSAQQALADSIYTKFGPKALDLTPTWLLPQLKDPTRFLRSIVFNEKMGLFSVPQFLVHAMTFANVMGIAGPKNGTVGALGALLHGWASVNSHPDIVAALSRIAENMGAPSGFFKEAHEALSRTGFMDVAGEHALMDAPLANKIIQNKGVGFLDAGQIFFRGGVKSLRAGSWYTAFKEFRDLHPIGAVTDDDLKNILYRADLLSHNMSRASTSVLTSGLMALPAQFYTYQLRLAELMFGKRLSVMEKTRLFGVNAALFGVPVGMGLAGTSYFGDNLRSYANANGYQVGENFLTSTIMEGLPTMLTSMITGKYYNIGERYGAKGAEPLTEALEGDKTFLQIFGGAAFNSLGNTVEQSNGLMHLIMSGLRGDGEALGNATPEDFAGPFKEITSVNGAFKIIAAARYGNWLSKNNAVLHPNSVGNSVFEALTGLSEIKDTDMWTKSQDLKANKAYDNKLRSMFQNRFSLGMQETKNKNYEQGQAYFKEAFDILHQGGYPEDEMVAAVSSAIDANRGDLVDRTNYNYYLKIGLPKELGKK